jgi:hypothetical protein
MHEVNHTKTNYHQMKRAALFLGLFALLATQANAQRLRGGGDPSNYQTALGARMNPWIIGFTIKHFIAGPHAIEGLAYTNFDKGNNATFVGLYEYHWKVTPQHPEFVMYAGGGAHIGFYDRHDYYWDDYVRHGDGTYVTGGLDGIIGVEYTFKKIPLNISADLKPFFNFSGGTHFFGEEIGGASVRYTFK